MKGNWKNYISPTVVVTGGVLGALGVWLAKAGNPPNMGLCAACFERDIAGALGLHRFAPAQYLRPEIPALILGAFLSAVFGRELKGRGAPSPAISFLLGGFVMIGALVFLGCPIRMTLRLGAGDLNALVGLAGFAVGIWAGTGFLKRGFSLGRSVPGPLLPALALPAVALGWLALIFLKPSFLFYSVEGPGSMKAPILLSLGAGLALGALAQRSRLCFAGGIRDIFLMGSPHLLAGLVSALLVVFVGKLIIGDFKAGFAGQPIAHSAHLWNFLGMALVGLGSALLGGCPFRQIVLAAQGDGSAFAAFFGMLTGAALAHNFALAASPKGVPAAGQIAVVAGLALCLIIGGGIRDGSNRLPG